MVSVRLIIYIHVFLQVLNLATYLFLSFFFLHFPTHLIVDLYMDNLFVESVISLVYWFKQG